MSKERAAVNCRMCSSRRREGAKKGEWFSFKNEALKSLEEERNFKLQESRCADYSVPEYISKAQTRCYASCDGSIPKITNTVNDHIRRLE
ncbi:hypothetical protein HN903_00155 [archaeon]|jgi:hypothetical protein|nr:hypothetical protein [archaeon]MBT7128149.1 hypothetical protein [archaeon]